LEPDPESPDAELEEPDVAESDPVCELDEVELEELLSLLSFLSAPDCP
jgi:hypothetical protein